MSKIIFLLFLLLFYTNILSYLSWDGTLGGQLGQIFLFVIILYLVFKKIAIFSVPNLKLYILSFMLLPFVSCLSSILVHNQGMVESIHATYFSLMYCLFFLLFALKVKEKQVLIVFCVLGVCWCLIEIVQQFTFPYYWFATRPETFEKSIEIRNGIYRYNVAGYEFGLILAFYSFQRFLNTNKIKYLLFLSLSIVGIYLLATRQIFVSVIFCFFIGLILIKKVKLHILLFLIVLSYLVYLNKNVLFGDFMEMTKDVDEDYIRFLSYDYYGLKYNSDYFVSIFGNGIPSKLSLYGKEINYLEQDYGLFRSDIGIVGIYSLYGIIYVLVIVAFFVYVFKNRKYIEVYLQMYLIFMATTSIMLHHFGYSFQKVAIMSCIFFLVDKSISKGKLNVLSTKFKGINSDTCV